MRGDIGIMMSKSTDKKRQQIQIFSIDAMVPEKI